MSDHVTYELPSQKRTLPVGLIAIGVLVAAYGLYSDPARTWPNLLLNGFYFTSLSLSALFFLATQRATNARWSASLRRIPEAFSLALPVAAVLMMLLYFGRQYLFPWTHPGIFANAPAIAGKVHYLQPPWVFTRMLFCLAIWIIFALLFRKASLQQDRHPELSLKLHQRLTAYSVLFILTFALTYTAGAFDWLISLEPEWFSTMFAVYAFAGTFVQGIAAITLALVVLKERGPLRQHVSEHQIHDLGKLLFAFTVFWAYIWTCQYLLIWYGNIPEEVTFFGKRTNGSWLVLFAINFIINWVVPFLVLLSKGAKCNHKVLKTICCLILVGRWLDLYLLITPSLWSGPKLGLIEVPIALAYLALLYLLFTYNLARAPLTPLNDPVLAYERLHPHAPGKHMQPELSGVEP